MNPQQLRLAQARAFFDQYKSVLGPKARELFARTAMTYAGLVNDSATSQAQHAQQFVNELLGLGQTYDDFLTQVSFVPISPMGTIYTDWELNEIGDIRKHTASTAQTHNVTETHEPRTVTPQIIDMRCPLEYERVSRWLRAAQGEGATLKSGVDQIMKALQQKSRNELQNLWINGNTDSTSAHLAIEDGWIKRGLVAADTDNMHASTWAATPDIKANLLWLRRRATQVRNGDILKMANKAFVMSEYAHDVFVEQLAAATSDSAHTLYFVDPKTGVPRYKGTEIYMPNYWPDDLIMLTDRRNLIGGICDEISTTIPLIEYWRDIDNAVHLFVVRLSGGCQIAKPEIILAAYDDANTDYVTWAAS